MAFKITAIDGGVIVENTESGAVYSYPSGSTAVDYNDGFIKSNSDIKAPFDINNVTDVSTIDDNRTGGAGSIAIPPTVKEIYDIIAPFFFKIAVKLVQTTPTFRGLYAVTFVNDSGVVSSTFTAAGHNYQIGDQVFLQDTPDYDGQHVITGIAVNTFTIDATLGIGFTLGLTAQSAAAH
jgi:hypothetical protein